MKHANTKDRKPTRHENGMLVEEDEPYDIWPLIGIALELTMFGVTVYLLLQAYRHFTGGVTG